MEYLISQKNVLRISINKWFTDPNRDNIETARIEFKKPPLQQLNYLTKLLLEFSHDEPLFNTIKSESDLMNKIFSTSRYQIRSFKYVSTLKKLRQSLNKIKKLNIKDNFYSIATSACSVEKLMNKKTFHSVQWRLIALFNILIDVQDISANLVELLTEEMTTSVFLHYPVAYTSLASSLTKMSKDFTLKIANLICKFRTMENNKFLPFQAGDSDFPPLPWNDTFITTLDVESAIEPVEIPQNNLKKLNISMSIKPTISAKHNKPAGSKPKTSFSGLGF
ncbi:hypothetical protein TVAG_331650 [Trichomonas vaginalis G3]|uniref:Nucleolus and neural progenitor protein-like N-terminal domain-containing protein n=1 Tax=Trichomonas vaginalis (strain ATCC PRA-98 / G3) TaxID=412133 RepID=A2G316_TRIV3|nr:protein of unknown function (DUF4477) family [Trichomonas vaginalis G3]EAX88449.1 hypothetical protein TVAG_331650 [Trichomonas vaginalis G3]KAI5507069.1 protein of unknown function (DUF4477) family [Trichomonas vaginalis G3]|eukprot:XP_001301379.1 hypothetical protein [Trichomonas vaginalis G3]